MIEIVKITKENVKQVERLFISCFQDDHYYQVNKLNTNHLDFEILVRETLDNYLQLESIWGQYENGELISFIIFFDYFYVREKFPSIFHNTFCAYRTNTLLYEDQLHNKIESFSSNIIYLLSIGVKKEKRNQGFATQLIDFVLNNFQNYVIVGDVSNSKSLRIYERRGFVLELLDTEYYLVYKMPSVSDDNIILDEKSISILVPTLDFNNRFLGLKDNLKNFEKRILIGYSSNGLLFEKKYMHLCEAFIIPVSYKELLNYQRLINISTVEEVVWANNQNTIELLYFSDTPFSTIFNETLIEMIDSREMEWSIIADIQVLFPVEISNKNLLNIQKQSDYSNEFINYLEYRTLYESGKNKSNIDKNSWALYNRINRLSLGNIIIKITQEIDQNSHGSFGKDIGSPTSVNLIVSFDACSNSGVLSIISLSSPFLISHYLDNIVRGTVLVQSGCDWLTFEDYIFSMYGIVVRGTPKSYITIPEEKTVLDTSHIASLLFCETIYSSNECLGKIIDESIISIVNSENGMGQYDRGFVCAYSNALIQFSPNLRSCIKSRLLEEAITFYYLELLTFEEAAINIARNRILDCINDPSKDDSVVFLKETLSIHKDFSKTIEFWEVQVRYPSSRNSVMMLRKSFGITELIDRFNRELGQLNLIFDSQSEIIDRRQSSNLNDIMLFLTLIQCAAIILAPILSEKPWRITDLFIITLPVSILVIFKIINRKRAKRNIKS